MVVDILVRTASSSPILRAVRRDVRRSAVGWVAVAVALSTACATARRIEVPEMRIVAAPVGPDGLEVYDAEILFRRGLDLLEGGSYADAALYFERLRREFPDDDRIALAHYNVGVCYIHLERGDEAVAALDAYLAALPPTASRRDVLDGRFKRGQALAVAKRYEEVVALFDGMLGEELAVEDRIEALVDAGVGHYMLGLADPNGRDGPHRYTAEYRFLEARRLYRQASQRARLDVAFFVAQASFYLAEIARLEFEEHPLRFPTKEEIAKAGDGENVLEKLLGAQLEEKCQKLLRAQYAYLRTIREEHPGWASAAGYSVGRMYETLHGELLALPVPPDLGPDAAALYTKLVRKKILILLAKAEKTWLSTAEMVTRTGAESEWAERTRESLARIQKRIVEEAAATVDVDDDGRDVASTPGSGAGG